MRIVPFLVSATVTAGLVFTLNIQLKLGGTKAPRLGYFLSPQHGFWKKFYTFVPALLLCYFIPGLLNTFGVINGEASKLYPMARDYLLPLA
ncbi:MAG: hypothetical protein RIQ51_1670, partial [Bacteroidota bacterium]